MKTSGPSTETEMMAEIAAAVTATRCRVCQKPLPNAEDQGSVSKEGRVTCVACLEAKKSRQAAGMVPLEEQLTDEETRGRGASNLERAKKEAAALAAATDMDAKVVSVNGVPVKPKKAKPEPLTAEQKQALSIIRNEHVKPKAEKPRGAVTGKGKVVKKADEMPAASKHPELVQAFLASIEQPKRRANSSSYLKKTLVIVDQGTEADTLWATITAERAEQLAKLVGDKFGPAWKSGVKTTLASFVAWRQSKS